jgi:hypothetical protein
MRDDPKKRGILAYLVKFYDIEGYEAWGREEEEWEQEEQRRRQGESQDSTAAEDTVQSSTQGSLPLKSLRHEGQDSIVGEDRAHSSSQGSMPSNRPALSLTDAVIQYPERLVEELVPMVGIIEENFTRSQERAEEFRMQSALRSAKRRLEGSQGTREELPKRSRAAALERVVFPHQTSSTYAFRDPEILQALTDAVDSVSPSVHTQMGWHYSPASASSLIRRIDEIGARRQPPLTAETPSAEGAPKASDPGSPTEEATERRLPLRSATPPPTKAKPSVSSMSSLPS